LMPSPPRPNVQIPQLPSQLSLRLGGSLLINPLLLFHDSSTSSVAPTFRIITFLIKLWKKEKINKMHCRICRICISAFRPPKEAGWFGQISVSLLLANFYLSFIRLLFSSVFFSLSPSHLFWSFLFPFSSIALRFSHPFYVVSSSFSVWSPGLL
jgi:hypothetical protein